MAGSYHASHTRGRTIPDGNPSNPKSRLAARLRDLTGAIYDGLSSEAKQTLFPERRQPRAKDKPVIR